MNVLPFLMMNLNVNIHIKVYLYKILGNKKVLYKGIYISIYND